MPQPELLSRRTFALQGLAASAGLTALGQTPAQAQAASTREAIWPDLRSNRELPVLLRFPAGSGPCGLVVYSHGLGGNRSGGEVWGQAWAAAGLAVIHVQHPGSDSALWRAPNPLRALKEAASVKQFLARVSDVQFVLSEVERLRKLGLADFARVRLDALGMAGHSFGAQTTQALAGQRYAAGLGTFAEPRFKAFIAFSPNTGKGKLSAAEQFGGIKRPFMCATGSQDGDPLGLSGSFKTPESRIAVYSALPPGGKALLELDQADHFTFAGIRKSLPTNAGELTRRSQETLDLQAQHHALLAQLSTQWWLAHLLADARANAALLGTVSLGSKDEWRTK